MTSPRVDLGVIGADDWSIWRSVRLRALRESPTAFGAVLAYWQGSGDTEARWRARLTDVSFNLIATIDGVAVGQASGDEHDGRVEFLRSPIADFEHLVILTGCDLIVNECCPSFA